MVRPATAGAASSDPTPDFSISPTQPYTVSADSRTHHPGPPRFAAVGETVELAPRDPDPEAPYTWHLAAAPADSRVTLGADPVETLVPDVPGTYVARLSAPDDQYDLTVRVFPSAQSPTDAAAGGHSGASGLSGTQSDRVAGGRSGGESRGEGEPGGTGGRPRVRLKPIVTAEKVVVRADPRPHPKSVETVTDLDVVFLLDDRDDATRAATVVADSELRLPRDALGDRLRVYAVAVGADGYSVPDAVRFERSDGVTATRPYDPPAWAENAFVYEIYVRSFTGEDAPLAAIRDRLDYVASLGVDTLWLTPILENDHAPHGYNITDFFAVASDLGTRAEYERLVAAAHDRDIRVLFDVVANHSARTHPFFRDAIGDPESPYRDWYEWRTETEPETYFEWEHIANFDFSTLAVRRHLLDAFDEWIDLVDGFRCDMAWAVPDGFWRELHDRCKARDESFLLLDETIPYVPDYQAGLFDVHFDSTTYFALRQIGHGDDADSLLDAYDARREVGFPDHAGFAVYAENHDESRYVADCGRPAAEAALGAMFTLPGVPMVYAGQEFGQRGRRDTLAWDHADPTLQSFVRRLARVRREHPALSGTANATPVAYEVHEGAPNRVTAFRVATGEASAVVVLHFGADRAVVSVPDAGERDAVSGERVGDRVTVASVAVLSPR